MSAGLTTDRVWAELQRQNFAVLGTLSPKGRPQTAGVVFRVKDRRLFIATSGSSPKARNLRLHPRVSLTVTIEKRVPFLPWIRIPPATISFGGEATLHPPAEVPPEVRDGLLRPLKMSPEAIAEVRYIRVRPIGRFVTYGVGVPLRAMLRPEEAGRRVPV